VVTQFGSVENEMLPAPKTGGLYNCANTDGFVEASPSRALRDGEGIFLFLFAGRANSIGITGRVAERLQIFDHL
jgi:hypothetical protein